MVPVQPPGREGRATEPPHTAMAGLMATLLPGLRVRLAQTPCRWRGHRAARRGHQIS
ncbi:hypothetical protein [Streptomyces radicis]|uniref:hypothetical protein n=1 Tax=Streptomyces radicis TaxID=1750517 RepID=UPI00160049AB|nr:hypothetical protein [Streptomyces radicis]